MFSALRRHTFILNTDHQIEGSRILNLMNYDTFTYILYAFTSLTTPTHNQKQFSACQTLVTLNALYTLLIKGLFAMLLAICKLAFWSRQQV